MYLQKHTFAFLYLGTAFLDHLNKKKTVKMESSLYAPENLQNQSMRTTLSLRTENWHNCQRIRKDTYL